MGRPRRQPLLRIALVCLAVPALAGCTALAARDDDRYAVEMTNLRQFMPPTLAVPVGSTVVWQGTGRLPHTATALAESGLPAGVAPWDSGTLYAGETWEHRFDVPGTYVYFCRYHGDEGMVGTIAVDE